MIVCGASEAAQQLLLELPGVNTCTQKMLNRLIFLVREGATLRMRKATTLRMSSDCVQPTREKIALAGSPSTPNQLAWFKMNCSIEESLIS